MRLLKKLFGGKDEEPATEARMPEPEPAASTPAAASPPQEAPMIEVNQITPQDLKKRLDRGDDLVVVDMRQGWEYQSGHIPGATHIFLQEIPMRIDELPQDKDVIFQCWHGNTSQDASAFLIQNGWDEDRVYSLSGGIAGWSQAFGPEGLTTE